MTRALLSRAVETAFRAEDVTFAYKPGGLRGRDAKDVLRSVSLEVRAGEVYGLLGPNGAGKTTLIKIAATLILPDRGRVEVLGHELPGGEPAVRPRIGLALAEYERTFHFRLTARQNLRFFASFLGLARAEADTRIDRVLGQVGLTDAGDAMYGTYSSGMKHRLAVARALLPAPELLILDEPTAGLDAKTSRELGDLVLRLAREEGATVLYTTHRLEEAGRLCDRIGILRRGELVAQETPAGLRRLAGSTSVLLLRVDRADDALGAALSRVPQVTRAFAEGTQLMRLHVEDVEAALVPVLDAARAAGAHVRGVRTEEPSVEDAFLALTKEGASHA